MTALRLVGTFFLVVCGWCAGDAVCIRTQEHLEALRQTIALLEEIEQEITFRRADLNMLSKKLQREHKLFCSAKMIQTAIPPQSFSPQEAACFAECFSEELISCVIDSEGIREYGTPLVRTLLLSGPVMGILFIISTPCRRSGRKRHNL